MFIELTRYVNYATKETKKFFVNIEEISSIDSEERYYDSVLLGKVTILAMSNGTLIEVLETEREVFDLCWNSRSWWLDYARLGNG